MPGCSREDELLFLAETLLLEEPSHEDEESLGLDGLRQELLGALLDRADGEVDRAVRREDDEGRVLADLLDLGEELERRPVRQAVVGDDDVVADLAEAFEGLPEVLGLVDVEAARAEKRREPVPDGGVVLHEEDPRLSHARPPEAPSSGAAPGGGRRRAPRPPAGCSPRRFPRALRRRV